MSRDHLRDCQIPFAMTDKSLATTAARMIWHEAAVRYSNCTVLRHGFPPEEKFPAHQIKACSLHYNLSSTRCFFDSLRSYPVAARFELPMTVRVVGSPPSSPAIRGRSYRSRRIVVHPRGGSHLPGSPIPLDAPSSITCTAQHRAARLAEGRWRRGRSTVSRTR